MTAPQSPAVSSGAAQGRWLAAMPWAFVLIWSTGFIVARYGMPHAPPMRFLALRFGLSALCFALWLWWLGPRRPAWPAGRSQWLHLGVTGLLMHAGYLGGVWAAVKAGLGAGTVALLVGLQPALTALFLATRRGDAAAAGRVSPRQWAGLALGLAGLLLVVWRKLGAGEVDAHNLLLALLGLLAITAGTLYQKRFVATADVRPVSLVQLTAATLLVLPLAALENEPVVWHPELVGALVWSVLALSLAASSLLTLMLQRGAATQVSSLMYLVPPCTALMGWLLFGETLSLAMLLGMVLTAAGVALVVRSASA